MDLAYPEWNPQLPLKLKCCKYYNLGQKEWLNYGDMSRKAPNQLHANFNKCQKVSVGASH